eukprot:m.100419 g.100419  ORF g.100419 m.100419 type:complete len:379 (-) comp15123_c0_seq2:26-1162(-)
MAVAKYLITCFVLSLVLPPVSATSCPTCRLPQHDWSTLPVFFHGSTVNSQPDGSFSDAQMATLTKFSSVTIEKWQAQGIIPAITEEVAWVAAARKLKAAKPSLAVYVWLDSLRIYTQNHTLNPDLKSPCTTGNFGPAPFLETHPEYLLRNSSGGLALEKWSHCHIYDFEKEFVREYWTQMCINLTSSGVIDGCGADASWQYDATGNTTTPAVQVAWDQGHRAMMNATAQALMPNGILLGKDGYELGEHVNGVLQEECGPANSTIQTLQTATATAQAHNASYVYNCHNHCTNVTDCRDSVAAFLIGAGPYHYFGRGGWTDPEGDFSSHWVPGIFDQPLGNPSPAEYDASTQVWSRKFSTGTSVTFDVKTNTGSISWSSL